MSCSNPARQGNAIISALIVMTLIAVVVATSTDMGVSTRRQVEVQSAELRVVSALDAVLARRQQEVIYKSTNERPEDFAAWTKNYGVDFIGDIEIRWKIEPATSRRVDAGNAETVVGNPIPGDTPLPGTAGGPPGNEIENRGSFYLYRIAAEARYDTNVRGNAVGASEIDSSVGVDGVERLQITREDKIARAQGVRYVVTPNESALNFLLYYALRGPKADLELSHGWPMNLVGDIYTGGATYFGSGTVVNNWAALRQTPSPSTTYSDSATYSWTVIGPPVPCTWPVWSAGVVHAVGDRVQIGTSRFQCKAAHTSTVTNTPGTVTGRVFWHDITQNRLVAVDGAFRLSKQVLYSAINGFPMTGAQPGGFTLAGCYDLGASPFPGERLGNPESASYAMPNPAAVAGDVFTATWLGTIINPMRANDIFATVATDASKDYMRQIMGVPLRGVDGPSSAVGNDGRDRTRTSASGFQWKSGSLAATAPGFNRMVRTQDNGTGPEELASSFRGRPEEPQRIEYPARDLDGDPTTDEHEYALPTFVLASGGTGTSYATRRTTTDHDAIEVPGTYMGKALGAGRYMARRNDYTGWDITDAQGNLAAGVPAGVGLVIRERPVPDTSYFTPSAKPAPTDPLYRPYAYGKVRSSLYPFTTVAVSGNTSDKLNGNVWASTTASPYVFARHFDTSTRTSERYSGGGALNLAAAMSPGSGYANGYDYSATGTNDGSYYRFPHLYQDHWRFIHLRKPGRNAVGTGLTGYYFNDLVGGQNMGPMGGRLMETRTDATVDFTWAAAPAGISGMPNDYFSVRWMGWIKAPTSDTYTVIINSDDGARLWIDNRLIVHEWNDQGGADRSGTFVFTADVWYPITIDYYEKTGGANCILKWKTGTNAPVVVPSTALAPPTKSAFDWTAFTAVQGRISSLIGLSGAKAGLMLRPSGGVSPIQDGRDPYVSLNYSIGRGITAQVRGERSRSTTGSGVGYFVGTASLAGPAGTTDSLGEIAALPTSVAAPVVTRQATLTPEPYSVQVNRLAGQTSNLWVYTPGSSAPPAHPYAGVAGAPATAWPADSGTGAWWAKVLTSFVDQGDLPLPGQGTIKGIRVGSVTLRTQGWPRARSLIRVNSYWNWRLGGLTDPVLQRFHWNPGSRVWPTEWGGLLRDDNNPWRYLVMFADPTGNRIFRTLGNTQNTWSPEAPSNQAISSRNMYRLGDSISVATGAIDAGGRLNRGIGGGYVGNDWAYWFPDADANLISDDAQPDKSVTIGSTRHYLYTTSGHGLGATIPGVYNGLTRVRDATEAEIAEALAQANGGTSASDWLSLKDANVAYPIPSTPAVPKYRDGVPDFTATQPLPPEEVPAVIRITAAVTNVGTSLILSHVRMLTPGDVLTLHSAAGSECTVVTGVDTVTNTVTVNRGVRGTTAIAHPANTLASLIHFPISALKTSITAANPVTMDLWTVPAPADLRFSIQIGDVLTISSQAGGASAAIEQVRVTAVDVPNRRITVTRGQNGTTARAWTAPTFAALDTNLNDGNANTDAYISPPVIYLGGLVLGTVNQAAVVSTTNPITLLSVSGLELGDIIQAGTELLTVTAIDPLLKKATVTRGDRFSTPAAIPNGLPLLRLTARTFAIDRSRTLTFDVNSTTTAGATPKDDYGWFWKRAVQYRPWKGAWAAITPLPRTGGFQSRVWGRAQTAPETVMPSTDTPVGIDNAVPTDTLVTAGRWRDDQPAAHAAGSSGFAVGDLVQVSGNLYRCRAAHTRDTDNTPTTGADWQLYWEAASVWLRIERVTGTSRVRFLYAVAVSTPGAGDWRPVVTDPEVDAASDPLAGRAGVAAARELQFDLAKWFRTATLNVAMTNVTTSTNITLSSGTDWVVGDVLAIDNELVEITAVAGSTLTVNRAVDGSAAAAHAVGVLVTRAAYRGGDLQVGPCLNGNKTGSFASFLDSDFAKFEMTDLKVENGLLAAADDDYVVDATDWDDDPGTTPEDPRYLASQYQVFFGAHDITEDFFSYGYGTSSNIAREDWFYNTREFWSQSRWWDDGVEKDPGFVLPNNTALSNREIWAKTTVLNLDMRSLQDYLRTRTLEEATADYIDGGYATPVGIAANTLRSYLPTGGMIMHVSRTNRYPWNPEHKGKNPWNPNLPNENTLSRDTASLAAEGDATQRKNYFTSQVETMMATMRLNAWNLLPTHHSGSLQPWTLATTASAGALMRTPPIKPQDFHHGIRLVNGDSIDWNHQATNGTADGTDKFGTSKMLVVTPNHLYIQGDFNTTPQPVSDGGVPCSKSTPVAVYGDSITFLSNAWDDVYWQYSSLTSTCAAVTAGGTLAYNQGVTAAPKATATTYAFAALTHNSPTTRRRVLMGEAAALDDNLLVLEDWATIRQTFIGSIVVMDTRRYTDAFRLDDNKTAGLGPMGFAGADAWVSKFADVFSRDSAYGAAFSINAGLVYNATGASDGQRWGGTVRMICGIPNRQLFYNPDFKTKEGTPPEMPFGIKSVGVGGWLRVLR